MSVLGEGLLIKINLAKHAGFCFGVKRALDIAKESIAPGKTIEMLGDIVHNEFVIAQIKNLGIKKVSSLKKGKNKTLLVRAHGTADKTVSQAKKKNYKVIDATCPMVKEIHTIVKDLEKKRYKIIVIGDNKHDEVKGIVGQLKNKALIIDPKTRYNSCRFKKIKKAGIVVQSTQNMHTVTQLIEKLKKDIINLKAFNTICNPTRKRQEEIYNLPKNNDLIIIIGSRTSANTRRLYEISKSINSFTYWIQCEKQLNKNWFKNAKTVGITAGASTPDNITEKVIQRIKSFF